MKNLSFIVPLFIAVTSFSSQAETNDLRIKFLTKELNINSDYSFAIQEEDSSNSQQLIEDSLAVAIDPANLKLMGRGVMNRKTKESLALGCVTENCSVLRTVYFKPNHPQAYFVGPEIQVSENNLAPSKKQIKSSLRTISRDYRDLRRDTRSSGLHFVKTIGSYSILLGMFKLAFVIGPTVAFPATLILAGPVALLLMDTGFYGTSPIVAKYDDHKGWSWSSKPRKVSDRTFQILSRSQKLELLSETFTQ